MRKGYTALAVIGFAAVSTLYFMGSNVSASTNLLQETQDMDLAFVNFIGKYQKQYATKEEFLQRMEVFKASLMKVQEHNSKIGASYRLGINKFSDWTQEERQSILGYKPHSNRKEGRFGSFIDFNTTNLNGTVDWRPLGWVTSVKD